jgi:hypothetical protein
MKLIYRHVTLASDVCFGNGFYQLSTNAELTMRLESGRLKTYITYFHLTIAVDQNIGGFHITMNHR